MNIIDDCGDTRKIVEATRIRVRGAVFRSRDLASSRRGDIRCQATAGGDLSSCAANNFVVLDVIRPVRG